jgi:carboxyl-terminal processing protease
MEDRSTQVPTEETTRERLKMKPRKRSVSLGLGAAIIAIVAVVSFVAGTRADTVTWPWQDRNPSILDLSSVQHTYSMLQAKFDGDLDINALVEGANRGLVEASGDPYTVYFSEEEAKEFLESLEGQFEGIGAEIGKRDDRLVIVSTLDDTPAQKSGLQSGDFIVRVNDQDASSWSIDKAVSEIRGPKGTTVKLTIMRNGSGMQEFSIVRDTINNPSVRSEIQDGIGILRISRFGESDTALLARQAAEDFKQQNVRGVVLDLRGNGGGFLRTAQDIAGLWLDSDKVVVTERRGDQVIETLRARGTPILEGVPTVVLVDGGSASASEIVAGALRDHDAATLVGTKTFGKGSVQQIEDLPGGAKLKVTIAGWFTPSGLGINQEGVEPDTEVDISEDDISNERDPQLDRAKRLLRE